MKEFRYLFIVLVVQLVPVWALATIRLVPGTYATIQAAVDAAADTGDEVHVTVAATYDEYVIVGGNKNLKIAGDVGGVIVASIALHDTAQLTLDNLTVTNKTTKNNGDGVNQRSTGTLTLTNCSVANCNLRGLVHEGSGNIQLSNSSLTGNSFDGYTRTGGGGTLSTSAGCVIANNTRAGFMVEGGTNPGLNLTGTEIRNNNVGIYVTNGTGVTITLTSSVLRNNPQDHMLLTKPVQLTMDGVTVENTAAPTFAAGIRFDVGPATASTAVFTNCQFTCPYAKNCVWVFHPASITITNCTFSGYYCSIEAPTSSTAPVTITLTACTFANTFNVPVSLNGPDGAPAHVFTADRCRFAGGSPPFNLFNAVATQATLTNCVFEGGDVQVWSQGDQSVLNARNCTFAGDVITTAAMFIRRNSPSSLVANCIIDKTYNGIVGDTGVSVTNHHNMVRALAQDFVVVTPGASTILDTDPQFVLASSGPGTGDFHLKATSPAIGAGDNTLGVAVDYDNQPRGPSMDIGAYRAPAPASVRDWFLF